VGRALTRSAIAFHFISFHTQPTAEMNEIDETNEMNETKPLNQPRRRDLLSYGHKGDADRVPFFLSSERV
jgi:hypothetical protein